MKKPAMFRHDQPLSNEERPSSSFMFGGEGTKPVYDIPIVRKHTKPEGAGGNSRTVIGRPAPVDSNPAIKAERPFMDLRDNRR